MDNLMNLFQSGLDIVLHSGDRSEWKIECDALSELDWEALSVIAYQMGIPKFCKSVGVPRGGMILGSYMNRYIDLLSDTVLVCDDVLTTGNSIIEEMSKYKNSVGLVAFSRSRTLPKNVYAIWQIG